MQEFFSRFMVKREAHRLSELLSALGSLFTAGSIKRFFSLLLVVSELFMSLAYDLPTTPRGEKVDMSKFELVFADEFNGDTLDETIWKGHGFNLNGGVHKRRGSNWVKEALSVSDGTLKITTFLSDSGIRGGDAGYYNCGIETIYTQKYGYFECSCVLPRGVGIWAAFWMFCPGVGAIGNGGVDGAEIDIFESPFYGERGENSVHSNIHYDGYAEAHMHENEGSFYVDNPYEEFNTYALEWNENEYIFYINGIESARTDFGGASQVEEYMILSVEMEEKEGSGWSGIPSDRVVNSEKNKGIFPSDFIIDYVRAYQYKTEAR